MPEQWHDHQQTDHHAGPAYQNHNENSQCPNLLKAFVESSKSRRLQSAEHHLNV
jgi:hypothetical protein